MDTFGGRRLGVPAAVIVYWLLVPSVASAQLGSSGIAGVVRDASGAVLPGVTVEAASPALIEKSRSVVVDGEGQYKILDLRAGTYTVTFTLVGFSTVKREGIELPSNFTAAVNVEMAIGSLEETVIVSGASPVVDVSNTSVRNRLSNQVLEAVPTNRSLGAWAALTPGLVAPSTAQDVGGSKGEQSIRLSIHGGFAQEQRVLIDGMETSGTSGAGSGWGFIPNPASAQEVSIELGGGSAESQLGGVALNFIPKDGGNTFAGYFFTTYDTGALQGDNLSPPIQERGLTTVNALKNMWDVNVAFGGPIARDKLWFHTAHRTWGNANQVAGMFENLTPRSWSYTPDPARPGYEDYTQRDHNLRLTWQASRRHRLRAFFEFQDNCDCHRNILGGTTAPEATHRRMYQPPNNVPQANWTFTATNRLLLEAGATGRIFSYVNVPQPGVTLDTISVLEQTTGLRYRAAASYGGNLESQVNERFSVSYVTGAHALKAGAYLLQGWFRDNGTVGGDSLGYTFRNGVPVEVTLTASPLQRNARIKANLGLYVQDQWTLNRLTLNMGLRFDYFDAYVPEQHLGAGPWVPARDFAPVKCVPCWTDLSPRLGAAYDLFGNGKTAVKVSLNRYVKGESTGVVLANNPATTTVSSATRSWNDANGDFVPQPGELGPLSNAGFGQTNVTTSWADDVLTGFGVRPYQWQGSLSVQQELKPNVALNVGYFRTSWANFTVTDNLSVTPGDYDPYCITAPVDSRLPNGGGQICGFADIKPEKFGLVNNLVTRADKYGKQTEVFNGVDVTINARLSRAAFIGGGFSTGRTATGRCFVVDSPQELRHCQVVAPFTTQIKLSGVYPLPWDMQIGAVIQSLPGIPVSASYVATNAQIAPSLGRSLSGRASTVTIVEGQGLLVPQSVFEGRSNQLDLRYTKALRLGRARVQGNIDLYNVLNSSPILSINTRYGSAWLRPTAILAARLLKFSAQLDF